MRSSCCMRMQQRALGTGVVLRDLLANHVACLGDLMETDLQGLQLPAAGGGGAGRLYTSCVWPIATTGWLPGCVLQPAGAVLTRVTLFLH